ncbi:hypothetical protein BU26DRAFT_555477 [Trematosphaeria pertusa]|uniref:Uncharacterized protein n=1 Tax=Trematosphaeria pertusa TaxID=390896 RepID=A0A6A6HVY3_9PLEO|nr:uncharacterized protein BU26DRAFT_555477 [Trematosphaeria pertusa]KAF2242191.1 hypothetical protein BU26DRAFT_555477 [Trematosphaeria pertusa]
MASCPNFDNNNQPEAFSPLARRTCTAELHGGNGIMDPDITAKASGSERQPASDKTEHVQAYTPSSVELRRSSCCDTTMGAPRPFSDKYEGLSMIHVEDEVLDEMDLMSEDQEYESDEEPVGTIPRDEDDYCMAFSGDLAERLGDAMRPGTLHIEERSGSPDQEHISHESRTSESRRLKEGGEAGAQSVTDTYSAMHHRHVELVEDTGDAEDSPRKVEEMTLDNADDRMPCGVSREAETCENDIASERQAPMHYADSASGQGQRTDGKHHQRRQRSPSPRSIQIPAVLDEDGQELPESTDPENLRAEDTGRLSLESTEEKNFIEIEASAEDTGILDVLLSSSSYSTGIEGQEAESQEKQTVQGGDFEQSTQKADDLLSATLIEARDPAAKISPSSSISSLQQIRRSKSTHSEGVSNIERPREDTDPIVLEPDLNLRKQASAPSRSALPIVRPSAELQVYPSTMDPLTESRKGYYMDIKNVPASKSVPVNEAKLSSWWNGMTDSPTVEIPLIVTLIVMMGMVYAAGTTQK